jgi:hypothetical protein
MTAKPPIPQLPGGPDPAEPVPRTPVDGFDLVAFAAMGARLATATEPRATTLERAGLDEARWLAIEKTWMLRVATALMQQDPTLSQDYDSAFAAAQAELASEPERSIEEYAALVAAIEAGREPADVLAEAKLSTLAFGRLQRHWVPRLASDEELARRYRAALDRPRR